MASANFRTFDRNLRRLHTLHLVNAIDAQRRDSFRASLVVNGRTGRPGSVIDMTPAAASQDTALR